MQQEKAQLIKTIRYIDLRQEEDLPFLPRTIASPLFIKSKVNSQSSLQHGFTTEEEMKESMPNEFMFTHGDAVDALAEKYAFFDEECEGANNFRQIGCDTRGSPDVKKPESPRLPTDFSLDLDDLATAKLNNFNFKRPPSPSMIPATMEPVIKVEDVAL